LPFHDVNNKFVFLALMSKVFKYQSYLDKYKNCPKDCQEKDISAYRWVHQIPTPSNFYPVNATPGVAPREVDDNDSMCASYALSLFKDADSAVKKYLHDFNRQDRPSKREKFKANKGSFASKVHITKEDGICDEPDFKGHFNFFEYERCDLLTSISETLDIFAYNGATE